MPVSQQNLMPLNEGTLYEIRSGYLSYFFNFTLPERASLLIRNGEGTKIESVPCQLK
jgi:hypothetical protein